MAEDKTPCWRLSSLLKRLLYGLIRGYQVLLSPLFGATCRYYPTCSHYAIEAIEIHGALKGSYLTIKRILRCHPFCEGGFDPVPNKKQTCTSHDSVPTKNQ